MSRFAALLLSLAALLASSPSRAFTPESGWWWNPNEPGYGFSIEIQDKFIFMVAFAYGPQGATWYAAEGLMPNRSTFTAPLYRRDTGTCLGCPFTTPGQPYAVGSQVTINFTSETRATLTWGGRTIQIQRHDYYLSRTPSIQPRTELWLGEWQAVMDWRALGGEYANYPYVGEVLIFDLVDTGGQRHFFEGCRPTNSLVGLCTQQALNNHDAAGFYSPADGTNIITVNENSTTWLVFEVEVGTYQFDGYAKRCPKSLSNLLTQCLDSNTYPVLPVRGWRSASRAYVQGDDNAPNAVLPQTEVKTAASALRDLPAQTVEPGPDALQAPRERADPAGTAAALEALLARLGER
ncbi:MAG: hypothetical protein KF823_00045 [Xanthomonadales bacterium]|nr:hypothetical protein [Xanthomonadales bacterium]